ncbi:SWIM zinc finger family protein [Moorena producens JHB]|uniref:SWIM zinc finger family protein n=1 Tax=Moorena producens (strain JHB) TaxID=1454205 RepID=A0A1D9G1L3_MOOP1|nr:SWIM zinc finger family protein [Moorena producens]AOY81509.1 SWIM zinc finger family protein [Moorena producens JHB]
MTNYEIETQEWWVERWNDLLNSYRFKKRLERGRIYAKEGNILSIDFLGPQVVAKVQGTAPEPYELTISIEPFTEEDWNYVVQTLASKAIYSAQLLAGEMPHNIEEVFTANGLSLFPFTLSDVRSRCNCPDPKNPCKHIAAVYYELGDRFSEDPFVLFQLRGSTKEQILDALRKLRSGQAGETSATEQQSSIPNLTSDDQNPDQNREEGESAIGDPETSVNIQQFWQYDQPLDSSLVVIAPPTDSGTVLDVLGTIPLGGADPRVMQYLKGIYQIVSQQAVISALNRDS